MLKKSDNSFLFFKIMKFLKVDILVVIIFCMKIHRLDLGTNNSFFYSWVFISSYI